MYVGVNYEVLNVDNYVENVVLENLLNDVTYIKVAIVSTVDDHTSQMEVSGVIVSNEDYVNQNLQKKVNNDNN